VQLSVSVWKVVLCFFSLTRSNSKHDFINKSEEGNLNSPAHSDVAGKSGLQPGRALAEQLINFGSLFVFVWKKL